MVAYYVLALVPALLVIPCEFLPKFSLVTVLVANPGIPKKNHRKQINAVVSSAIPLR
jgi:hypothetical protein